MTKKRMSVVMVRQGHYVLAGHTPVLEVDLLKWGAWFETTDRTVAKTDVGASVVSTVFLGLDHQWGTGAPLLFESMIFTGGEGGDSWRCSTWGEAEAQHEAAVRLCQDRLRNGGQG